MRIFITGSTSLVGKELVKNIVSSGNKIICLVRESSNISFLKELGVEIVIGDLRYPDSIKKNFINQEIDIFIHIAGIMFSDTIMDIIDSNKINRIIFISTTGIFSKYKKIASDYKEKEKEIVRFFLKHNIQFIVLRPTMIYGNEMDHNIHKLILYINSHKLFPIFNSGNALLQPVYYKDVTKAILNSIEAPLKAWNQIYNISGREPIKYKFLIQLISEKLNKKILLVHIPVKIGFYIVELLDLLFPKFPLKGEQVLRMVEDRSFNNSKANHFLNFCPLTIEEGLQLEIKELIKKGFISKR